MKTIALTPSVGRDSSSSLGQRYPNYLLTVAKKFGIDVIPVILPDVHDEDCIRAFAEQFDGFLMTGGVDIDPARYGEKRHPKLGDVSEERDFFELTLLQYVIPMNKPVFGICRGIQTMNVALGGSLWQDIYAQALGEDAQHFRLVDCATTHLHEADVSGWIAETLGQTRITVNSYHHQAVKVPGDGLVVCARALDGISEAIESEKLRFYRAVQWHPEMLMDENSVNLLRPFLEAVAQN